MLSNYLKIAFRNIGKNKGFSFLNFINLAVGMAACILIFLYARFELSYDKFHKGVENIYRIDAYSLERDIMFASTPAHLTQTLQGDFPDVASAVRVAGLEGYFKYQNKMFSETRFYSADPKFFEIFSYPLISGSEKDLSEPFSVFISKKIADKYFGNINPVGKTITFNSKYELVVKGVFEDVPENSYLQFDILVSMNTLKPIKGENWLTRWVSHDFQTFIKLKPNSNKNLFEEKLNKLIRPSDIGDEKNRDVFSSQPITDIHLSTISRGEIEPTNSKEGLSFLLIIGAFILIIACLNYLTLSTTQSTKRNLEIGIRKVLGADKKSLIIQYIGESTVLAFLSFVLAVILAFLFIPFYNNLLGTNLGISLFPDIFIFALGALVVGIIAGLYPAAYLSSFQPSSTLKIGKVQQRNFPFLLPKILVVAQFIITISLITCTLIIYDQIEYVLNQSKHSTSTPIVVIDVNDENLKINYQSLLTNLKQSSNILETTVSFNNPSRITWGTGIKWKGEEEGHLARVEYIDYDYINFYGLKIKEGREFLPDMSTDKTESIIINETAAKESPWTDPLGKHCIINFKEYVVVGIVEDYHIKPLYDSVEPLVLRYISDESSWAGINYISLKINKNNIQQAISFLENTWSKHSSAAPFTFSFLDDMIEAQYSEEKIINSYFIYFTSTALLLANLGLIGLTTFAANRRKKEIGIRKVLGARFSDILFMLFKDIVKWVSVATLVAFPIAYYSIDLWLQKFAYRIDVDALPFVIATFFVLTIALLSTSYISTKAATTQPVNSLKSE